MTAAALPRPRWDSLQTPQLVLSVNCLAFLAKGKEKQTRQHSYRKEDRAMRPIYGCT